MKFSKYIQECINIHHLTPQTVAFAHLVAVCKFTEMDAASVAFPACITLSSAAVNNFCINLHKQCPGIQNLIKELKQEECNRMEEYARCKVNEDKDKERGERIKMNNYEQYKCKEGIVDALAELVEGAEGKERADILIKIADLKQFKKEQNENLCKTVHFYLPAR